jgi:hypothetical protein
MSIFCTREYFGYRFIPRSGKIDIYRTKLTLPSGKCLLPYFNGSEIQLDIKVVPPETANLHNDLKYKWIIIPKDKDSSGPNYKGEGVVKIPININSHIVLDIGHFPYTGEYELKLEVGLNDKLPISQTIVDYEFVSRASFLLNGWLIIITAIITYLITRFTS